MQRTVSISEHQWTDPKRWLWLASPMIPLLGVVFVGLGYALEFGLLFWLGPLIIYGLVPLLDWLIGQDSSNPPDSAITELEDSTYYRGIVYAYLPAQYAATVLGAWIAVSSGLSWWELLGLVVTTGMVNGIGINTAHELGHKKADMERWLAKLTLAPVAYGHFYVEHNRGHHKNVATPLDPASSRMGESFYAFLPRTVIGSLKSAWALEKGRLHRKGQSVWSKDNDNLQAWAMTVVLFGALSVWLGWGALVFLVVQAAYGAALLEVINYIEHYGLLRQKNAKTGRYERCRPVHSWNSNNIMTNLVLYQLQRHADHHANPTRRFQALRHFEEAPQLPNGYAAMLVLAYVPPLWFKVMDKRVVAHHKGDLSKAHLHQPKREQLLREWSVAAPIEEACNASLEPGAEAIPYPSQMVTAYQCSHCEFIYDEATGCEREGFAPGTPWAAIPVDWACPDCAVREKPDFRPYSAVSASISKAA